MILRLEVMHDYVRCVSFPLLLLLMVYCPTPPNGGTHEQNMVCAAEMKLVDVEVVVYCWFEGIFVFDCCDGLREIVPIDKCVR